MSDTYVSLFAGIGGLDLAAEAFGYECVGQVEWDAACTRVLERWWPGVPRWGDVRGFTAATYAERGEAHAPAAGRLHAEPDVPRSGVGLIVGGFPCQPVSTAGRREGQADDRWLWPEFARVVGELRPRHVLVENVPGLLTVNGGRAFSEVIGTLADLGYDATWRSLRAADIGAPHRRERIFILANAQGERLEGRHHGGEGQSAQPGGLLLAGPDQRNAPDAATRGLRCWEPPGATGRPAADGTGAAADAEDDRCERAGDARGRGAGPSDFDWGPYEPAIRRWERVLMRPAPHPVDDKGQLGPPFVEWMMGFPAGWTDGMSRTQALKALGNAVVPQQGAVAFGLLASVDLSDTGERQAALGGERA